MKRAPPLAAAVALRRSLNVRLATLYQDETADAVELLRREFAGDFLVVRGKLVAEKVPQRSLTNAGHKAYVDLVGRGRAAPEPEDDRKGERGGITL